MELSQMITQGIWRTDSLFLQLPHTNQNFINNILQNKYKLENIYDFIELEDDVRDQILHEWNLSKIQKYLLTLPADLL